MRKVILASGSPRRKELLARLGWPVEVRVPPVEEEVEMGFPPAQVAMTLAARKAAYFIPTMEPEEVVIAADTVVALGSQLLGKPATAQEAAAFLRRLSGRWHEVYTGVAVATLERSWIFYERTAVRFHSLPEELIQAYVRTGAPLDKAGAYGAQDFIGLVGIAQVNGDFYNVMGLPVQKLAQFWLRVFGALPHAG